MPLLHSAILDERPAYALGRSMAQRAEVDELRDAAVPRQQPAKKVFWAALQDELLRRQSTDHRREGRHSEPWDAAGSLAGRARKARERRAHAQPAAELAQGTKVDGHHKAAGARARAPALGNPR